MSSAWLKLSHSLVDIFIKSVSLACPWFSSDSHISYLHLPVKAVLWKQVLVFHVKEAQNELLNQDLGNLIFVKFSFYTQKVFWGKSSNHLHGSSPATRQECQMIVVSSLPLSIGIDFWQMPYMHCVEPMIYLDDPFIKLTNVHSLTWHCKTPAYLTKWVRRI